MPEEPDVIEQVWEVFRDGGTPAQARLLLAGRSVYIPMKPRLRAEQMRAVESALRESPIQEVQRRFNVSRSRLYEIRQKLKL
jgi:hypothetical protein